MKQLSAKKVIRYTFSIVIILIFGYYGVEVISARANTQKIVDSYYQSGQIKVTTDDLSSRQLEILLQVEDPNFYKHHGVDFKTPGAGWTTITQGLAKRFYFKDFKQGIMKIKQTLCHIYFNNSRRAKAKNDPVLKGK